MWEPVPPLETFAEALSVPPWLHTIPRPQTRVLVMGNFALPLANLALRYPTTSEVIVVSQEGIGPRDKRVTYLEDHNEIEDGWKADVAAMALPAPSEGDFAILRHLTAQDGVAVVAVDQADKARAWKNQLRLLWPHLLPYREHAPDLALFFLLSDRRLGATLRPWPQGLKRLHPTYLPSMFAFPRDEYQLLYGEDAA